ncbi:hypothetical protein ACTNDS_15850 [Blautia sp. HCP3S3_C12]|uniref:hypothetical protein n=1 Tax=unclassified Blautia TaxID=2648079 RepID=UPI003F898CDA
MDGKAASRQPELFNGVKWILKIGVPGVIYQNAMEHGRLWYKRFAQWQKNGKLKALLVQFR